MTVLEQNLIAQIIEDLGGVRLVDSGNCSEMVWAINDCESKELAAKYSAICQKCASGGCYDLVSGRQIA